MCCGSEPAALGRNAPWIAFLSYDLRSELQKSLKKNNCKDLALAFCSEWVWLSPGQVACGRHILFLTFSLEFQSLVCLWKTPIRIGVQFELGHVRVLVLFLLSQKGVKAWQSKSPVKAGRKSKSVTPVRQEGRKRKTKWSAPAGMKCTPGSRCTPRIEVHPQEQSAPPRSKCTPRSEVHPQEWSVVASDWGWDSGEPRNKEDRIKWGKDDWGCGTDQSRADQAATLGCGTGLQEEYEELRFVCVCV